MSSPLPPRYLRHLPWVGPWVRRLWKLDAENRALREERAAAHHHHRFVPLGHFYSPYPSLDDIEKALQVPQRETMPGIEIDDARQQRWLQRLVERSAEAPFPAQPSPGFRYHFENPSFAYFDGCGLFMMLRELRPRHFFEVGVGNSSCLTLDTNDRFFEGNLRCTFIDPFPGLLQKQAHPGDLQRHSLLAQRVQDVPLDVFRQLEANDILFIDSSHVSKIGSDVNHLFFEVLPVLQKGVVVHIHDVCYPLEYPRQWLEEGRAWNEQYLLRAFLMYSHAFEIEYYPAYVYHHYRDTFDRALPRCHGGGGGLWLRKVIAPERSVS